MKDIVIFGAGGFGREVQWLIERLNERSLEWNILGYIDDRVEIGTEVDGYSVLGGIEWLLECEISLAVACAVGNSEIRKGIIDKISENENVFFPNLIDPSVLMSVRVNMGVGNLICAGTILTVDIEFGDFNIINLDCTIGHDASLASFVVIYPSVNISGNVEIGEGCEIGTGTQILQGKVVADGVIIGAGSVVTKDIMESGTYVGVPARKIG